MYQVGNKLHVYNIIVYCVSSERKIEHVHKHSSWTCSMAKNKQQQQQKTRHSVEHSTPHADGARLHFTGLSYRF